MALLEGPVIGPGTPRHAGGRADTGAEAVAVVAARARVVVVADGPGCVVVAFH